MRAWAGRTSVLWVLAALAAACSSGFGGESPAVGVVSTTKVPGRYVALGDSYAAGEGNAPFEEDSVDVRAGGDGCHRSSVAYPRLLAGGVLAGRTVEFRACSGARRADVFERAQTTSGGGANRFGRQVEGLGLAEGRPPIDLVTITVGGNDVSYSRALVTCALAVNCPAAPFPDGKDGETVEQWAARSTRELGVELAASFAALKAQVPGAKVVVTGYPHLFPSGALDVEAPGCGLVDSAFDAGERAWFGAAADELNAAIERAAAGAGFDFVAVADRFAGHEACSAAPFLFGLVSGFGRPVGPASFHPNPAGHAAYAEALRCEVAECQR